MKILVKGAFEPLQEDNNNKVQYQANFKQFIGLCKALGIALATRGHTIMVGVPEWNNLREGRVVANYVLEGASTIPRDGDEKTKVIFYAPKENEPPDTTPNVKDTLAEFLKLPNLAIEDRFLGKGSWSAAMIPDVQEADAVILIGGGEGTATIGYAAYSIEKPVIAITSFGGAAQSISEDVLFDEYTRYAKSKVISERDLRLLSATWSELDTSSENRENAHKIVQLTEKLIRTYIQSNSRARTILWLSIGFVITLALAWVAFYLGRIEVSQDVNFFLLLFVASILGTGLRTLVSYQDNRIAQLTYVQIGIDIAIAFVIALGLAMVYLIGGISFTGKVVVLDSQQSDAFASIAISMSLLGLAAGYLVPLAQLEERLQKIITPE